MHQWDTGSLLSCMMVSVLTVKFLPHVLRSLHRQRRSVPLRLSSETSVFPQAGHVIPRRHRLDMTHSCAESSSPNMRAA